MCIVSNGKHFSQPVARKERTMRIVLSLIASALVFGLLAITAPLTSSAGKSANETAFKQLLVESSPWSVRWKASFYNGTFKISFAVADDGKVTGKLFENSGGRLDGALENVVAHDNGCVSFISGTTGTKYNYCMEEDGILKGTQEYTSEFGVRSDGITVALPAGR